MKNIVLSIILLFSFNAHAQSDKIIYILSDATEIALKKQIIEIRKNNPSASFSFMLWNKNDSTRCISLLVGEEETGSDFVKYLIKNTNRALLIDKERLPLILDYDFKFSSPDLEHIGDFGKREGNIKRLQLLFHGYTVFFNLQGEVLGTSTY